MTRRKAKAPAAPERPSYPGKPRNHEGEHGANCDGGHFVLGQALEHYVPPIEWHPWRWGNWYWWHIAVFSLDDGTFLAWAARHKDAKSGGSFLWSRRFASRDEALRANCAEIIRMARRWTRHDPVVLMDIRMPADVAKQMIEWAFEVAGKSAPDLFVAPAPPPPPKVERDGQIRMF